MKSVYRWLVKAVSVASSLAFPLYFTYYLWKSELLALWHALQHVTVADTTAALFAAALAALLLYLLGRRQGWPHKNIYDWLIPYVRSILPKRLHGERLEGLRTAIREEVDDYDEDDEDEDEPDSHEAVVDRWADRIEEWSHYLIGLAFWIAGAIIANTLLHSEHTSGLGLLIRLVLVVFAVSLVGLQLRYVLAAGVVAIWLDYVFLAQGQERSAAQAAMIGVCLVAWNLWRRWRDKIQAESPPAEQP